MVYLGIQIGTVGLKELFDPYPSPKKLIAKDLQRNEFRHDQNISWTLLGFSAAGLMFLLQSYPTASSTIYFSLAFIFFVFAALLIECRIQKIFVKISHMSRDAGILTLLGSFLVFFSNIGHLTLKSLFLASFIVLFIYYLRIAFEEYRINQQEKGAKKNVRKTN